MHDQEGGFDAGRARAAWDDVADAYAGGQSAGLDFYRYEFLGPAQVRACGDVAGLHVLDVGCGSGYLARELAARGARVLGVDIAPRMIEHARRAEAEGPLGVQYQVGDAAELGRHFPPASFDMAVSCLALQDMPSPGDALEAVRAVLPAGGRFVASITHPCTDTPFRQWERDGEGGKRWLCIDRYFEEAPIEYGWERWGHAGRTPAVHATLERWFGWIGQAGFQVRGLLEPRPGEAALQARSELEDAARVPYYIVFDLVGAA